MKQVFYQRQLQLVCGEVLTFGAVIALPAVGAHSVALGRASVVAELVVPGPAEVGTAGAVVVLIAENPVLVAECRVRGSVLLLVPVHADVQPLLGGQPGDQGLAISCNNNRCAIG